MKKKIAILALFLLAGCSLIPSDAPTPGPSPTLPNPQVTTISAPDPEDAISRFLDGWNNNDYENMYAMLSQLTRDSILLEDFSLKYDSVSKAIALTGVEYSFVSSLVNPQDAQVRYQIVLKSALVGDITRETWMDLSREGEEWKIAWTDAAILPELAGEDGMLMAPVVPTRANIYDRNGLALAAPADVVALWIVPNEIGDEDQESAMLGALSRLLDRRSESILDLYDDLRATNWYVHLGEVTLEEFTRVQNTLAEAGGVNWRVYTSRYYYDGGLSPHAIGYTSWISELELESYLREGYRQDDFVGKLGVELVYESELRGIPGGTLYQTNSSGQAVEIIADRDPEPPYAIYTTLDRDLQQRAQNAIAGFTGAAVVLERDTGAILAMVSSPGFDPNFFDSNHPYSGAGLQELFADTQQPLFPRATHGTYPPGSVFKIITMAAALESGYFEPDTIYNCGNEFTELPGITLYDWTFEKEYPPQGEITLIQALERSCNPYFYHIGLELYNQGLPTAIGDMAIGFGLGASTGIEIGDESGLVPDPDTKIEQFGEEWGPQDSVNLAIGQSFLQATPLQVVRYVAAIGNGGTLYQPQITNRIQTSEGVINYDFEPIVAGELPISEETIQAIQAAMVRVVRDSNGTARTKFLGLNLDVAGKTGTATTGDFSDPHAWFAGYTFEEREDLPDIAIVVLAEFEGEGSDWSAPIFRRIVESYFLGRPYAVYPWESQIGVLRTPTPTPGPDDGEGEADATPVP
jgi:penicillin-binding protein 2